MRLTLFYILLTLLLISCSKDDIEYQNDYDRSYKTFQQFKKNNNNSYIYKTTFDSWVGFSSEYTFEVDRGVIISRTFTYTQIGQIKRPESGWTEESVKAAYKSANYTTDEVTKLFQKDNFLYQLEWKESKSELGTKQNPNNILTLDQIYDKAKTEWLIKRKDASIYFEDKNNGMISLAGYVDQNCQDDCFIGITINSITPLN